MSRIRQEDIEAVKERTDIVPLVSQYLALKKSGHDSMSGLCPFHQEKTASFSVSPSKGVFYCFGCGKGGDAITFLRELESLSYVEAVERLAQLAGVTLRFEGDSATERRAAQRRNSLFKANEEAAKLYQRMLLDGREAEDARAYVQERGLSAESLEGFGIGYAPGYPDFLLRRMAKDLGPEVLLEAGLATKGEDGVVRDRFRGRLTFPIQDLQGRYLGFGARVLPSDAPIGGAGEVPEHRGDADLPEGRDPLQPPPGTAGGRALRPGVRGRGLHGRDRARPGRDRQRGRDVRDRAGGSALQADVAVRDARGARVRLGRGGRAGGRAGVRVPGAVPGAGRRDDHAGRAGSGGVRGEARGGPGAGGREGRHGRWSSTWSAGRSSATT